MTNDDCLTDPFKICSDGQLLTHVLNNCSFLFFNRHQRQGQENLDSSKFYLFTFSKQCDVHGLCMHFKSFYFHDIQERKCCVMCSFDIKFLKKKLDGNKALHLFDSEVGDT